MQPLRYSVFKQMGRSAAHARYAMEHETPDTPSMRMGRLAHSVFLGQNVPLVYEGERRGNAWKAFKAEHDGADIVTAKEFHEAGEMAASLHSHREARSVLMGHRERTILFDFAGRPCRATPDVLSPGDYMTELKGTNDASHYRFPYTAVRLGYHGQLAWYQDGILLAQPSVAVPERLFIVAFEMKPPYAVCVYQLTPAAIDFGRRLYRTWLEEFLNCEKANNWPGYPMGVLDAPENGVELVGEDGEVLEVS